MKVEGKMDDVIYVSVVSSAEGGLCGEWGTPIAAYWYATALSFALLIPYCDCYDYRTHKYTVLYLHFSARCSVLRNAALSGGQA